VRRYTDSNNLVLLVVLLECERVIALIAVNCEQLVGTNYSLLCILIKVLQLLQAKLICRLAVLRDYNNLVLRQILLFVLGREVIAALKDNKG
jgi:hypothetical protein